MLRIVAGDFDDRRVIDLLAFHHRTMHAQTPKGSAHALDLQGLRRPEISFWTVWEGEHLVGMGALKDLGDGEGEVKSMRTVEEAQRKGIATAMLNHIIAAARARGMKRLYLETGAFDLFAPAVTLYRRHGFVDCPPFAAYRPDPNSLFLTLAL